VERPQVRHDLCEVEVVVAEDADVRGEVRVVVVRGVSLAYDGGEDIFV
jgi:hypothetical protein